MAPLRMLVLAALAVSTLAFTDKAEGNKHALAKAEKKADLLQSLERTEPAAPAEAGAPAKPFFYPFYPMVRSSPQPRLEQREVGRPVHKADGPLLCTPHRRRSTRMPSQSTRRSGRRPSRRSTRARSRGTTPSRGGRCGAPLRSGSQTIKCPMARPLNRVLRAFPMVSLCRWMWPCMGYYMWLSPWMWMFWY